METIRERLWRSMRIMKTFSLIELQVTAKGDEDLLVESTVRKYLNFLELYGYVQSYANNYWLLVKNTGPLAPHEIKATASCLDKNLGKTFTKEKPFKKNTKMLNFIKSTDIFTIVELQKACPEASGSWFERWINRKLHSNTIEKIAMKNIGSRHYAIYKLKK